MSKWWYGYRSLREVVLIFHRTVFDVRIEVLLRQADVQGVQTACTSYREGCWLHCKLNTVRFTLTSSLLVWQSFDHNIYVIHIGSDVSASTTRWLFARDELFIFPVSRFDTQVCVTQLLLQLLSHFGNYFRTKSDVMPKGFLLAYHQLVTYMWTFVWQQHTTHGPWLRGWFRDTSFIHWTKFCLTKLSSIKIICRTKFSCSVYNIRM